MGFPQRLKPKNCRYWWVSLIFFMIGFGLIWQDRVDDRRLSFIDLDRPIPFKVLRVTDGNPTGWKRDYRALGEMPGRQGRVSLKIIGDPSLFPPGHVVELYETGDPTLPLVMARWVEETGPHWRIGAFSFTPRLPLGALFFAVALALFYRRGRQRRVSSSSPAPDMTFWLAVRPEHEGLVRRLSVFAARHPAAYKRRVLLLGMLGYSFPLAMLFLSLASCVALVVAVGGAGGWVLIKLVPLFLAVAWSVVSGFLDARIPPPDGLDVTRTDAPRLFELLDRVRKAVGGPPIHRVLIASDNNAGVLQRSRFPGLSSNTLRIGLPLLILASEEEMGAVLAHEFAHLAGGHGRMQGWIYHFRQRLALMSARLAVKSSWTSAIFSRFFRRFVPYFNAYSFVLARESEYVADRAAATFTDAATVAGMLVRVRLDNVWLARRYWMGVWRRTDEDASPRDWPYAGLEAAAAARFREDDYEEPLTAQTRVETGLADTHPALCSRLSALGCEAAVPPEVERPAIGLLGDFAGKAVAWADADWWRQASGTWKDRHEEAVRHREELARLSSREESESLPAGDRVRLALLHERFANRETAMAILREVTAAGTSPLAAFHLGRMLLSADEEEGVAMISQAMDAEDKFIIPGTESLAGYFERTGQPERLDPFRAHAGERLCLEREAEAERVSIAVGDEMLSHGLDEEQVAALTDQLAGRPDVRRAWLVRKKVKTFPDRPLGILMVEEKKKRPWSAPTLVQRLVALQVSFPFQALVVNARGRRSLARKIRSMKGSLIYDSTRPSPS